MGASTRDGGPAKTERGSGTEAALTASPPLRDTLSPRAQAFAATHWSVVMAAGCGRSGVAHAALATLCRAYWYPLYAFVRRRGYSPDDAQDLTQEFFARLIAKRFLDDVDRSKGKFRSFLLAALKHFLANEWDKARAQKRGGGQPVIALDAHAAEERYALEPAHEETADRIFDRRWALTLLDEVLKRLREEYTAAGKGPVFEQLKSTLTGEGTPAGYADIGADLGMSEGAVKVAVHRLRRRYRETLRAEIAETVTGPAEVEEELRHLFAALTR